MEKILILKTYVDGGINDTPFPNSDNPIEIGEFRYDAKRMGGAPTITASVNYPSCLDDEWTDNVYAEFNGEKYYLKQTPTSSRDNANTMYKHDITLVSERVALDNVYFFDVVTGQPQENDAPVSNSTKVNFFGDIQEFATRLGYSLEYSGIPYRVVVDNGIESEDKLVSFEDQFFSNAIQESYNTYDIPYYFKRNEEDGVMEIHFGYTDSVIPQVFEYGVDNALLSITKTNSNNKVVNRATARGSSENIPFYYPNNSSKGDIAIECSNPQLEVKIKDYETYGNKVKIDEDIVFSSVNYSNFSWESKHYDSLGVEQSRSWFSYGSNSFVETDKASMTFTAENTGSILATFELLLKDFKDKDTGESLDAPQEKEVYLSLVKTDIDGKSERVYSTTIKDTLAGEVVLPIEEIGRYNVYIDFRQKRDEDLTHRNISFIGKLNLMLPTLQGWVLNNKSIELHDVGLDCIGTPQVSDTITQRLVKYVNTSENLMPSIYRATDGADRFYSAVNYPFLYTEGYELKFGEYVEYVEEQGYVHNDSYKKKDGTYYHFSNEFVEGKPKEHIFDVDGLKPTIKEATNDIYWLEEDENGKYGKVYQRIDMFSEFAYDENDSDETYEDENDNGNVKFKHSYFFAKLRKLPFNLFDHAIEDEPMTVSFTTGNAGACKFKIGVTEEYPQLNPVQVNEDGTLKRDEEGRVICGVHGGVECQPIQQDTTKAEVWIALMKEEQTYGILMPKATIYDDNGDVIEAGHRPVACSNENSNDGDTFVITGIHLPKEYITNAEKKLEAEIVKYISENNIEKFKFSINFSRIFFEESEENEEVLRLLDENSRIRVSYNGETHLLYVNSYSYSMSEGESLPQIKVELDEELSMSQNALERAVNSVKSEIGDAVAAVDILALANPFFLRKDKDDEAIGKINFKKGIKFGEGGKVEILDNNSAKLTIDYLEVTKKATFTSLEIEQKNHVGGQILLTPAAMNCGEVEELEDCYRCYFQTKGEEGDEIFNQFTVDDLAICQTYNTWGSRYYWRQVVGVGSDYIDLSKTLCDEDSDIPMEGDKIIQLGNKTNRARQAAQVLSSYGTDAPSFIMYNGIDDFTLADKNVTGIIWNPNTLEPQMYSYGSFFFGDRELKENYITYQQRDGETEKKLHINADVTLGTNSEGLSNLEEFKEVQGEISKLNKTVEEVQDQIDGVVENWSGDYSPTTSNEPAWSWLTHGDEVMIAHINDTFVNIEEYVDDETTPDSGKAWRWCKCDNNDETDYVEVTDKEGNTFNLHWHPIADSDAVRALREASELRANIDTFDYLKNTFAMGETTISGGVVMTEMVAVGEGGNNIEAFLNGNDELSDDEHGTLIIAAGIPESGSKFENRAKEALTRIYEDGTIETKRANIEGTIVAKSGKIGDFNITSGIESEYDTFDETGYGELGEVSVRPQSVKLYHYSKDYYAPEFKGQCDMYPAIGGGVAGSYAFGSIIRSEILDNTYDDSNYPTECVGIIVSAKGAKGITANGLYGGNFAIKAENGMFAGLRPRTRTVTSSTTLSALDHTIMIVSTSAITLTLPNNPEIGQEYDIYFAHQTEVNFPLKSNDISIHWPVANIWGVKQTNITGKGVIKIICANDQNENKLWWVYRLV